MGSTVSAIHGGICRVELTYDECEALGGPNNIIDNDGFGGILIGTKRDPLHKYPHGCLLTILRGWDEENDVQ